MTDVPLLFDPKVPSDVVECSLDFKTILNRGETLLSANVSSTPSGLTLSTPVITKSVVTTFVGGGTTGSYYVNYHVVTSDGNDETRSVILNVKNVVP